MMLPFADPRTDVEQSRREFKENCLKEIRIYSHRLSVNMDLDSGVIFFGPYGLHFCEHLVRLDVTQLMVVLRMRLFVQ
jgi:hypothetical protein